MDPRITAVALVCALVGGAAGWFLKPADTAAPSGLSAPADQPVTDTPDPDPQPGPELGSDTTVLKAELDSARKDLRDETARREGAEARITELQSKVVELRSAAAKGTAPDAATVSKGVRYAYDKYKKPLEAIDWDVAGDAVAHIGPLLKQLVEARAAGKPIEQILGSIQRYNGPLVTAAFAAQQGGVPGTGVNGSFTHPAMLANMVYATLLKAGKPLDETQEKKLNALADDSVKEDERRLAGYDERALGIQKLLDETALKDRFYAAVDALVTDAQREILHPEVVRGRTSADLFSSGVLWATVLRPARYKLPEEMASALVEQITVRYQVPADQKTVVQDLAAEWVKSFPAGYLDEAPDTLALAGHLKVSRLRVAAERQLVFFRGILDRLPSDWAGAADFRKEAFVLVPIKVP